MFSHRYASNGSCAHLESEVFEWASSGNIDALESKLRVFPFLIDAPNEQGSTAMHFAARNGQTEVVELLYKLGSSSLDLQNKRGCTPLYYATKSNFLSTVKKLVQLGSTAITTANYKGFTPMSYVFSGRRILMLELFCSLGREYVDFAHDDLCCCSSFYYARMMGSLDAAIILHRYGIDTHFVRDAHNDIHPARQNIEHLEFGTLVHRLYFARSLAEVLFFAPTESEKKKRF